MYNPFKRKVKLAQTQEALDVQVDEFLADQGFPNDADHKELMGVFIQHLGQEEDFFVPSELARRMRAARAKQLAFYVIHPEKRNEGPKAVSNPKA